MPARTKPATAYQIRITLLDIEPPVWRRFAVRADIALPRLHRVIQGVMGWEARHLHRFRVADERFGIPDPHGEDRTQDERRWKLSRLAKPGERLLYEYDFGDGWKHLLEIERELPVSELEQVPVCLEGGRRCPPEDCGGPWGYEDLLQAIADPKHEEHAHWTEWIGGRFDPEAFDLGSVNRVLREIPKNRAGHDSSDHR